MRDETDGDDVRDAGRRLGRRGVLTGLVGLVGVGTLAGRVRASHPFASDQSVDAGDLSRGQTATVQTVEVSAADTDIQVADVSISGVDPSDLDSIAVEHGGTDLGSAAVSASSVSIDITDVNVAGTEQFDVVVTVADGAAEGTLTLSTSFDYYNNFDLVAGSTSSVTDGAPESIVVPDPEPVSVSRPHFSLVADRRSWLEGVDGAERVTVTPASPRVGEPVVVEATVTNVGTRGGRYVGRLTNWFEILGREEVYLDVGEKTTLTYEFSFGKTGTHRLFLADDHVGDVVVTD